MLATIDNAGRMVISKALRDQVGLGAGKVNVEVDGAALRIEVPATACLEEHSGRLLLPDDAAVPFGDELRAFRHADQR